MNRLQLLSVVVLIIAIPGSCTFDRAIIYKKGYEPGSDRYLRFDGFYLPHPRRELNNAIFPKYFYTNGSFIDCGAQKDTAQLRVNLQTSPQMFGYWGNYKIFDDTIILESFMPNGGSWNYDRSIQTGIIQEDKIVLFNSIDRDNNVDPLHDTIAFIPFGKKPDSSQNWIRKRRKYNK